MVLAFFAASDGIVLENLAMRFMTDVQLAEAPRILRVSNCDGKHTFAGVQHAHRQLHQGRGPSAPAVSRHGPV
jgi:hypothetical protein